MPSDERMQHSGRRTPPSTRRRLVTQRRLSDYGFSLFRAGNVEVMVQAAQGGGAQQTRGEYTAGVELRHGIAAVPPWRNALWLRQQQHRGGGSIYDSPAAAGGTEAPSSQTAAAGDSGSDVAATSDDESGLATADDSVIAPASESAATTPEHNLTAAREAVDDWHRRNNSAWHVFAAVACDVCSSHPDGVAVQCLACLTFKGKGKAGQARLHKFGPFGSQLRRMQRRPV